MVKESYSFLRLSVLVLGVAVFISGCGYTTKSNLPENIKTIYVEPVKNGIDLSAEITDKDRYRTYRPGVEVEVTDAIIRGFIFDGNLKIAAPEKANAIVESKLIDYRRDPLRYSEGDDIQEYRLSIVLDVRVYDAVTHKDLWHNASLTGDTTFFLSGQLAESEDEAATKATNDVARRVVEQTMEAW